MRRPPPNRPAARDDERPEGPRSAGLPPPDCGGTVGRGVPRGEWAAFAERLVTPDGRVVDTGNGGISHSEGQGWGMLLALHAEDRPGFERIAAWTRHRLRRRPDRLHAWRWDPAAGTVTDPNNASDGDLFIAAALTEAGRRWSRPDLLAEGRGTARDLLRLCTRPVAGRLLLLPAERGFEGPAAVVVNPSYYALPMLRMVARALPDPAWLRLAADGIGLLRESCFGPARLPADWVAVSRGTGRVSPAPGRPPRFGFEAVRVPLWLAWAGLTEEPGLAGPAAFWREHWAARPGTPPPAWVGLADGEAAAQAALPGMTEVARLAAGCPPGAPAPAPVAEGPYYSAALALLARLAAERF